ncbi:hypothetical protein ME3_01075 [Bartonella melophagi K-2C]|uniref:Uncharacterized protein n=1 Tax=Bartonella melophagi K-2C TaxID=1094557 RepID=J0ZJP2_9HYPH|nr:hypothetical protein ME3_01075 [Bartonella melophagi K-2C]
MSIYEMMCTGVSGMNAQGTRLSVWQKMSPMLVQLDIDVQMSNFLIM